MSHHAVARPRAILTSSGESQRPPSACRIINWLGERDAETQTIEDAAQATTLQSDRHRATEPVRGPPLAGSPFSPGAQVGRYHLLELIGEGGMGRVLRAHDSQLGRDVAFKVVSRSSPHARARLLREARTLARIAHPNVVPVFDVGMVGEDIYLAMELVDGLNIEQWLDTTRAWRDVLEVFVDAGRGLRAVHAAGIVHRDFKPQNVVVGTDGRARVTDFGLALREDNSFEAAHEITPDRDSYRLTATGAILGTPAYMAPEQALGGTVDHRADQFAFCVSLFEALFGAHPFDGTSTEQLLENIANRRVRKLDRKDAPAAIVPILVRGLDPDPARRWPDMDELLAALVRCRPRASTPTSAMIVLGLGAGAIAALVVSSSLGPPAPSAPRARAATARSAVAEPASRPRIARSIRLTSGPGCEEDPDFSPDARQIVFDSNQDGDWDVFTVDRRTLELRQLTSQPGWDYGAQFSPDGKHIAYVHQDEAVRELRLLRTDDPTLASRSLGDAMGAFDWLDATSLVAPTPDGSLLRIGIDGTRAEHARLPEPHYIVMVRHHRGELGLIVDPGVHERLLLMRGGAPPVDLSPRLAMSLKTLAWSPRGAGFYFAGRTELGSETLYWRALDASQEVSFDSPPPGLGVDVASDGTALAMSSCQTRIHLFRLRADRPAERLFPEHDWHEFEPSRAHDGSVLIGTTRNGPPEVFLVDLATGKSKSVTPPFGRQGVMSPDGSLIAYLLASPTGGTDNGLWIRDRDGKPRQLMSDPTLQLPAFSHDGRWIYVIRGESQRARVYRVAVGGGEEAPVTPPGTSSYAVSPTADDIAFLAGPPAASRLYRGPATGPFRRVHELPAARYSTVLFSPDGTRLAIEREPHDLLELDLAAPARGFKTSWSGHELVQNVTYAPDGDGFVAAVQIQKGNLFLLEGTFP